MYGENDSAIDLDEVASILAEAEVLIVAFQICAQRLLIDLRADDTAPPLIELVEPVGSAAERARWLTARRPSLGSPRRSWFFMWPHSIDHLEASGLLSRVVDRIHRDHGVDVGRDVRALLGELRQHERQFTLNAIRGAEGFETLWSRAE